MARRSVVLLLCVLTTVLAAAQAPESVDSAAIAKIRDEGLNRSQVMETMFWLTDRYGPRLTGSKEFEEAGDWAVKQLQDWGVANVKKERFQFGRGWSLVKFHATMTEPRVMPIIGLPKSWTPGTSGLHSADVVRPQIANAQDAEKWRGKLRGKIVLTQPEREVRMLEGPIVLRYADDPKWIEEALSMPPARGAGAGRAGAAGAGAAGAGAAGAAAGGGRAGGGRAGGAAGAAAGGPAPFNVNTFYREEGVLALFDRGGNSDMTAGGSDLTWQTQRVDGGTIFVQSGGSPTGDAATVLPQVTLAVEHYNRMVRLLDHNTPVKVDLEIDVATREETQPNGFNVVGEIPGTDKAGEIVLIGAHFDSWHGGTGATDNAAGSAAMMEVLRILKATGLKPRRTVRIGLWGAEEGGLLGSQAYVREHLGTREEPKPELGKTAAYFNLDNGTGKIRGIWMQSNPAVKPIFEVWTRPLKDLGVEILGPRSVSQTDHTRFDTVGVPAFQFVQERYEYNSRTHHSNMDVYDRVQAEDMKQIATVAAVFVWHTATREAMLPRKTQ
ncbi:MAG TPA: M20/M25/M40 family metallo-hydrolase [Vicinamibacterales bacterium]|nr:M20/M25/M40 family metallo-hydrolase [Vicinamibacterales bacterium]